MKRKLTFRLICIAVVLVSPFVMGNNAQAVTVYLEDMIPHHTHQAVIVGSMWPTRLTAMSYRSATTTIHEASVEVVYDAIGNTLHGTLTAINLKPNFAYQLKLAGNPDIDADSNERIGLAGRWWQEEWNGTEWTNGQNLNDKGVSLRPVYPELNPNDVNYFAESISYTEWRSSPPGSLPLYRISGFRLFHYR